MKASFKRYATALLLAGGVLAAQESPKFPPVNATTQVCSDTADSRRLANDTHGGQKTGQVWYFNVPTASVEGTRVPLNLGEQDKVQIHICNNPFLYTYVLETPETAIQSDDVVGKIFSSLGLSTTNSDSSTKAGSSKPEATGGTTAPYAVANKPFELINHGFSDTGTTPPACAVDKLRKAAADLTQATVTLQRVEGSMSAKALTQEGKDNETNLSVGATNYLKARKNFVTQFNEFLNDRIGGPALKDRVSALVGGTLASYNELASPSLETSLLQNARESTRAANNVRDAKDALDAQISQATKLGQCSTKGVTRKDAKPLEDAKKEFDTAYANATTVQKDAKVITESLKSAVSQAVYNTCVYLHRKNHEYKSMLDKR